MQTDYTLAMRGGKKTYHTARGLVCAWTTQEAEKIAGCVAIQIQATPEQQLEAAVNTERLSTASPATP